MIIQFYYQNNKKGDSKCILEPMQEFLTKRWGEGGGGGLKIRRIVTAVFQFRMFVKTLMPSL